MPGTTSFVREPRVDTESDKCWQGLECVSSLPFPLCSLSVQLILYDSHAFWRQMNFKDYPGKWPGTGLPRITPCQGTILGGVSPATIRSKIIFWVTTQSSHLYPSAAPLDRRMNRELPCRSYFSDLVRYLTSGKNVWLYQSDYSIRYWFKHQTKKKQIFDDIGLNINYPK